MVSMLNFDYIVEGDSVMLIQPNLADTAKRNE